MDEQKQQPVWQQSNSVPEQPVKDKSKFATVGFILGLCGLVAWLVGIIGLADGVVGIVMSVKGLKSSKRTFAIIGLVLSILCIIASVILYVYNLTHAAEILKSLHIKY